MPSRAASRTTDSRSDANNLTGAERRAEILRLSSELFADRGYHNTSMQDIAEAAQIQKASIYYYYKSKDEILSEVLEMGVQSLLVDGRAALEFSDDPREKLRELLRAHVRNLRRYFHQVIVFLSVGRSLAGQHEFEPYFEWRREYDRMYVDVIREGQDKGLFRRDDAQVMAYGILGSYNWLVQWWQPDGRLSIDEIHEILAEMALRALAPDKKPNPRATGA